MTMNDQVIHIVRPPAEVGPDYWARFHALRAEFHGEVGDSCGCGATAEMLGVGEHDAINAHLGKPVRDVENLRRTAEFYQRAVEAISIPVISAAQDVLAMAQAREMEVLADVAEMMKPPVDQVGVMSQPSLFQAHRHSELSETAILLDISGQGEYVRERVSEPESFDPESFRTLPQGDHRVIVGKRKGKDATESQSILHPRSEEMSLVADALERGIPVLDESQQVADEVLNMMVKLLQ